MHKHTIRRAVAALTLAGVVGFAASAASASAPTAAAVHAYPNDDQGEGLAPNQVHVKGFYRGETIEYLDLGPVKLAPGNDVDPIWVVTNGTAAQHNVLDTVPGDPAGYTPLWQVTTVTWKAGAHKRTLRSAADIHRAAARGLLTVTTTDTVVNCPVLGFGQPVTHGFFKGERIGYYDLGTLLLAPGNDIDPIWVVTNGTAAQGNIIDNAPPAADYTPLWSVVKVTWNPGVTARTLRSAADVQAAEAAGQVTLVTTDTVVNCPVV